MAEYPFKDLLPIDEVLEQEGYYKDWTHLDPEVFYSLTQISEYIKTKGYGVDVRLLIAQLAEHFSLKTSQINEIERFFKDVMQELAEDKDFYSLPEIAGARRGYSTLAESLGNLSINMINKNLGKLDQTFMSDELLQQMAGNTPINAVPADRAITTDKIALKAVTPNETNFVVKGKNIFDIESGRYPTYTVITNNTPDPGKGTVNSEQIAENYTYFAPAEPSTTYTLSKTITKVMRVGASNTKPVSGTVVDILFTHTGSDVNECTFTTLPDTQFLVFYVAWDEPEPGFIQLEKGSKKTQWETYGYKFSQDIRTMGDEEEDEIDTSIARQVFIEEMNNKAKELGLSNTRYNYASGIDENISAHYSTVEDILKMGVHALGYDYLLKVWSKEDYTVSVEGTNPRDVTVNSTVINPTLDNHYHIIGGKTGTATDFQNMWVAVEHPNGMDTLVGVVSGTHTINRYQSAKELFDIAVAKMNGDDVSTLDIGCNYGIVGVLPHRHPFSTIRKGIDILWSKNAQDTVRPASTSKTMAVMVALDNITNFEERVEVTDVDFVGGANSELFPVGDIVKVKDLFYGAMLPSQNTLTETLRRVAGEKIIISRNQ